MYHIYIFHQVFLVPTHYGISTPAKNIILLLYKSEKQSQYTMEKENQINKMEKPAWEKRTGLIFSKKKGNTAKVFSNHFTP